MANVSSNGTIGEYPPELLPICNSIEDLLSNRAMYIFVNVSLALLAATLVGIVILVGQYARQKIVLHPNLLLLFYNIIFMYFFFVLSQFALFLRYRILLFIYKHPCELLTPVWLVPFFIGFKYAYLLAFPAFHFFIMLERVRATLLAEKYEQEGIKFGIKMSLLIWTISLGFMVYVIMSAFADEQFSHPQGMMALTTKNNNQVILYVTICTLPPVIVTAIGDWRVTVINKRKSSQNSNGHGYSLNRKYQLNENALTMRLILPLDILYALVYSIYQALVITLRAFIPVISNRDYVFYYYMLNTILFVYVAVAVIVYIQFMRYMGRKRGFDGHKILPQQTAETNLYFKQLQSQWA